MIEAADIFAGIKARWDGDASLAESVPGGLHALAAAAAVLDGAPGASPYATCQVKEQPPNWTSGSAYWQSFLVTLKVWSRGGVTNAGVLRQLMRSRFNKDNKDQLDVTGVTKVLEIHPAAGDLTIDPRRKEARDVLAAAYVFELVLQGTV